MSFINAQIPTGVRRSKERLFKANCRVGAHRKELNAQLILFIYHYKALIQGKQDWK